MTDNKTLRTFDTGATRDTANNKPDYEGFLSPEVLVEYGNYMLAHQKQSDGNLRASDNWQKGIPQEAYIKSLFRHFMDLWRIWRGKTVRDLQTNKIVTVESACCAIMFNVMGYLFEHIKKRDWVPEAPRLEGGSNSAPPAMPHDGFYTTGGGTVTRPSGAFGDMPVTIGVIKPEDDVPF